jgi:hypothetical protein
LSTRRKIGSREIKASGHGLFHATVKIMAEIEGREEGIVFHTSTTQTRGIRTHDTERGIMKVSQKQRTAAA